LPCDIFLSDHGSFFSFEQKRERLARGENPNPFIDPDGYKRFVDQYQKEFRQKLDAQKKSPTAATPAPTPE
jgi:metallo-beta-lactamase class B